MQQPLGQPVLQGQARRLGRRGDRLAHLVGTHRPEDKLPGAHGRAQHRVSGGAGVEVSPQPEHYQGWAGGESRKLAEELCALGLVLADGKDLFELVHDDDGAVRGRAAIAALAASASASAAAGCAPGVSISLGQCADPACGSLPSASAASRPHRAARTCPPLTVRQRAPGRRTRTG